MSVLAFLPAFFSFVSSIGNDVPEHAAGVVTAALFLSRPGPHSTAAHSAFPALVRSTPEDWHLRCQNGSVR
jgi:invasion protein IalB